MAFVRALDHNRVIAPQRKAGESVAPTIHSSDPVARSARPRFLLFMLASFAIFALFQTKGFDEALGSPYLELNAITAAHLLEALGEREIVISDNSFQSARFGLSTAKAASGMWGIS